MLNTLIKIAFLFVCMPSTGDPVPSFTAAMHSVKQIPLPDGFERVTVTNRSFAAYLQDLPLRKNKTVYLYNKQPKPNQNLHYAVIDISTGDKDLQQCADAIMRLRAEYFFQDKLYDSINFPKGDHTTYQFSRFVKHDQQNDHNQFMKFMEMVFINCGTYTLEQQLKRVTDFSSIKIGDVFIKGGAPGHAEIIVDMAINKQTGKKIYLLAEGYMPAQDIHILLNPSNPSLGPWYEMNSSKEIVTATWIFSTNQLRQW